MPPLRSEPVLHVYSKYGVRDNPDYTIIGGRVMEGIYKDLGITPTQIQRHVITSIICRGKRSIEMRAKAFCEHMSLPKEKIDVIVNSFNNTIHKYSHGNEY